MNEQQINQYVWPWKQLALKGNLWKSILGKSVVLSQPHLNYPVCGESKHWSGRCPGGLRPCLVALAELYYSAHGEQETTPVVLSGKKIFLAWNFQNLLSSYIARHISDCQEGVKPVRVSLICLQRGRNIICLILLHQKILWLGAFPGSHCDLSLRTTLKSIIMPWRGGRREETGCQTGTKLKIKLPLLNS